MVVSDEKGNSLLLNTINNKWAERIARTSTIEMGGSVMLAIYPMKKEQVERSAIHNILSIEEAIGRKVRNAKKDNKDPVEEILSLMKGYKLFQGKVSDINRRTTEGFAKGIATIEGIEEYSNTDCTLHFQNEHLLAESNGKVLCVTPDLIAVLDADTGVPITTEGLKYGARCVVIGMPAHPKWRTEQGIETTGPRYFGYDVDYQPLEELQLKEIMS